MNSSTQVVAWWGAIIATVVLVWDVIKWLRNAAIIRFVARPNVWYPDSEVIPLLNSPNGASGTVKEYIHIELTNTGTLPTTIMHIGARRRWKQGEVGQDGSAFKEHYGSVLPYILKPGEVWSCRADQDKLFRLPGDRPLEIVVRASHRVRPIIKRVNFPTPKKSI